MEMFNTDRPLRRFVQYPERTNQALPNWYEPIIARLKVSENIQTISYLIVWMYMALTGGVVFILIQLWLLVFFARSLGNKINLRIHEGGSKVLWYGGK